jgi:RNA polymerase sigma factor (sigma-70 family)
MVSGKSGVFISVMESHKGIIYKVARLYCKAAEDRKDLVQEITLQLWKSFDNYNKQYKYSTWIYRISLNVAISFYRKTRHVTVALDESFLEIRGDEPDKLKDDYLKSLEAFIAGMKDLDKALMLLYLEEKTHKEMAEILGISETNVATKISRIKALLKQKFTG